jgi:hypothetical protein
VVIGGNLKSHSMKQYLYTVVRDRPRELDSEDIVNCEICCKTILRNKIAYEIRLSEDLDCLAWCCSKKCSDMWILQRV